MPHVLSPRDLVSRPVVIEKTVPDTSNDCVLGDLPAALLYISHMKNPNRYLILKLKAIYHSSIFLNNTFGPKKVMNKVNFLTEQGQNVTQVEHVRNKSNCK